MKVQDVRPSILAGCHLEVIASWPPLPDDPLVRAVKEAAGDAFEVIGDLDPTQLDPKAYLAREASTRRLVGLRLVREGDGESYLLDVLQRLDDTVPAPERPCPNCSLPLNHWGRFCVKCRANVARWGEARLGPVELRAAVHAAAARDYDVLGEVERPGAPFVTFAREKRGGRLVALRMASGRTYDNAARLRMTTGSYRDFLSKAREYWTGMLARRRARRRTGTTPQELTPFNIYSDKRGLTIPLQQHFRFIHEPTTFATAVQFVGRENEMESLVERILFSEGGSFLVTGYRGVGKTSFVNQVIRKLEAVLPWAEPLLGEVELLDIYLNVARPVQPSEIMHHIIRRLHGRLVERGIYGLLDPDLREALTLAYQRTSINMARKLAESSERSFSVGEASVGTEWLKATFKAPWSSKRSRTTNYEMSFLGYDDKAAEHDIINISRRLAAGYLKPGAGWARLRLPVARGRERVRLKIVFVFDELDKLEEFTLKSGENGADQKPVIDQIIGSLKNLFTTSGLSFVFVAGKDLQERWLEDVGRGDSVYESVFAYDKYLPCLWNNVDTICDALIDPWELLEPYRQQAFDAFKKYLAYRGRGIPRRIIRTFNEYVEWNSDYPVLAFTAQEVRRIRLFAGLQELITLNETTLFGEAHEEFAGTYSDKRRLGVYYLIDWILARGNAEFTIRDVLTASAGFSGKVALVAEIAPRVAEDILNILVQGDYVQVLRRSATEVVVGTAPADDQDRYRVAPRRLVELGGRSGAAELESNLGAPGPEDGQGERRLPTAFGAFRIVREIGRGGMSTVYEAIDERIGRKAAIKVLREELMTGDLPLRFKREASILAALNHTNIVKIYSSGEDNGQAYIAMELLDGVTLDEVVERRGRLDVQTTVAIARPIAEAAQYVHERGIVRNDIKPGNVILTVEGRICLLDFGISRPKGETLDLGSPLNTATGFIVGTPQFMAPEQLVSNEADERSDVYALGVVLYKMLTGRYLFEGSSLSVMSAHVDQVPPPPSTHASVPPWMERIVLRCLEKKPEDRFQSMRQLAAALQTGEDGVITDLKELVREVREIGREVARFDRSSTQPGEPEVPGALATRRRPSDAPETFPPSVISAPSPPDAAVPMTTRPWTLPAASTTDGTTILSPPFLALVRGDASKLVWQGEPSESGFPLRGNSTLGRISENDLVLRDASVSRYHAKLDLEGGDWFIEDMNSSVGTSVGGERLIGRRQLRDADEIRIGEFVFAYVAGKAATTPPVEAESLA
jgi:serine/threonine protein kinase/Cdc6-like AAA superfamily ATPase